MKMWVASVAIWSSGALPIVIAIPPTTSGDETCKDDGQVRTLRQGCVFVTLLDSRLDADRIGLNIVVTGGDSLVRYERGMVFTLIDQVTVAAARINLVVQATTLRIVNPKKFTISPGGEVSWT